MWKHGLLNKKMEALKGIETEGADKNAEFNRLQAHFRIF